MPLKNIAVDGCTLNHKAGSTISGGSFSITSVPSTVFDCDGNGVYKTPLQYTFSGGNAPGMVAGSVQTTAPQAINATATKTKSEGSEVMRVEDFGNMVAIGTLTGPPPVPGSPVSGPVEISDAGQTKSKGQ